MNGTETTTLDPILWRDLLRVRYLSGGRDRREGLDCWGLVATVLDRMGQPVPESGAYVSESPGPALAEGLARGGWRRLEEPEPGAVVLARVLSPEFPDHVGIYIGDQKVLHIGQGGARARLEDIEAWRRRGWLLGCYVRDLSVPASISEAPGAVPEGFVRVLVDPDPIGGRGRETVLEPWRPGLQLRDLAEPSARVRAWVDGWETADGELELRPGANVTLRVFPAIAVPAALIAAFGAGSGPFLAFAGNVIIGSLIGLVASVIAAPSPLKVGAQEEGSPTFALDAIRNTVANGTPVAVVYGKHRVGGHVLQAYFEVGEDFRSTLYLLVGIGEGEVEEIGGYSGDWTGLPASSIVGSAIELDGNPAASFPTARFSMRAGRTRQAPIPGFDRTVVAFGQDRALRAPSPLVPGQTPVANNAETFLYTTSQAVDGFALIIRYPIGLYKIDATSGQEEDYSVYYTLRYQRRNNPGSEVVEVVIHGPSQRKADHSRMIRRLGLARDVYDIRITRMSDNDENLQRRYSASTLIAVNEYVSDDPIARNGKALLALEAVSTAQLSGGVPTLTSIVKGKKVHVWDGVSETAPSFTFQWSSNPAWVALDILLNRTYGLGRFFSLSDVVLADFKAWADYCDELITTDGTQHKRWEFDFIFDTVAKAWDALGIVAAAGRATLIVSAGRIAVKVDKATNPSMLFSMGNIVTGSMLTRFPRTLDRPNLIQVGYRNVNLDYDADVAQLETGIVAGEQYVRQAVNMPGVTDPKRAYRVAKYLLNIATLWPRVTEWQSPIDAVACEPGDVVQLQHDVLEASSGGGRLYAVTSNSIIHIDRPIKVPASPAWKLVVQSYDSGSGTRVQQVVTPATGTYLAGEAISVSPSFTTTPAIGDVYAIGPSTSYYTLERITKVSRGVEQVAKIEAVAYDAGVYDDDPGEIETFTDVYPQPRKHVENPTGLRVVETIHVLPDGATVSALDVSFAAERAGLAFDVWLRRMRDDDLGTETNEASYYAAADWIHAGTTTSGQIRVTQGFELRRPYLVSVTPRSRSGNSLDPRGGATEVVVALGKVETPAAPTGLKMSQLPDGRLRLDWTASTSREVVHYEVRSILSTAADSRRFLLAQVVAPAVVGTSVEVFHHRSASSYFLVSAVSRAGVRSMLPASISYTPKGNDRSVLAQSTESVAWPGTKTKMTVTGTTLRTDLGETTGSYVTGDTTHALLQSGGLLSINLEAVALQIDWTVDQCGYLVSSPHAQRMTVDGVLLEVPEPEQRLALADNDYPVDSPGAYLFEADGARDWPSGFKVLIEYDLATDSGATTWDGWTEYLGPIDIPANRYYVRIRATVTNFASAKLRIEFSGLGISQTAQKALTVAATDPNSHYSGSDNVDARLIELGYAIRKLQDRWPFEFNTVSDWNQGTATYDGVLGFGVRTCAAGAATTIVFKCMKVPNWYQATGGTYFTVEVCYRVVTIPATDKQWVLQVGHSTFDIGEAVPALTWNQTNVAVASTANANYVYRTTFNITVGALGAGDEFLAMQVKRYGTHVNDTLSGASASEIRVVDVKVTAGVKTA